MDDQPSSSIPGTPQETAEPTKDTTTVGSSTLPPLSTASKLLRESSASSTTTAKKLQSKRNTSTTSSPAPSRESSPIRPQVKNTSSNRSTAGPGRARKNSSQDPSPSRSASTAANPPSAAATQRALSAATTPNLHPVASDSTIKAPTPQKPLATSEIRDTPRWPVSPRLRSPPPVSKQSVLSPRKTEHEVPAINVQRTSPAEHKEAKAPADTEADDSFLPSGMRTPVRGASGSTLETVQEISQPNTPGPILDGILEKAEDGMTEPENSIDYAFGKAAKAKGSNESGSDSGGKGEIKMRPTAPPTSLRPNAPAKSYSTNTNTRGKPSGEGSTKNMTVETETVSSIPQVAVGGPPGGNNGSIRAKPSSETIRPKKEKKKTTRKTPSVTSGTGEQPHSSRPRFHHHHTTRGGISADSSLSHSPEPIYSQGLFISPDNSGATSPERPMSQIPQTSRRTSSSLYAVGLMLTRTYTASSKADIFEAKVASAVDEADSSDSEETFVYESNPPEANDRPRRFHSRTPSATSMASQIDQRNGVRATMDGGHSVAMKKSMKFANSYNDRPEQAAGEDDGKGTARSNMGTGRGTTHHHHIPRWGRNNGNGHPSLFDNESPFPNVSTNKFVGGNTIRQSSRPSSPRVLNGRLAGNGKKQSPISSGYDFDDGADDERTPLIGTVRSARSGRNRRPAVSSLRRQEHQASRDKSYLARFAGCLALTVMIILVISGAVGFMFATTQPLTEVKILAIKNVLASEQDVIFDMQVQARNPNLMAVAIDATDLIIFAKSKYAGTDHEYYKKPHDTMKRGVRGRQWAGGDPFDPPNGGDPTTNPNLEIGRVYELYSPLTFEGSPFKGAIYNSVGQVRITHPGNHTTPAGSERWGKVVEHDFELLVRGTLKYTLPSPKRSENSASRAEST
ncbi:hypothetical protein D0Z07_1084 [Hyphodiscus hymeniophilus]|uniref:Phospholipid metabolism enzyme regulator n=1 Tax=Hyphodiscus hymeniophilus TaxID=353542 RepID=A0A9P6VPH8_9HELO|nr:hypothetical protein D0Z07_1084 [Hyphodiscus hymeniophilus]